MDFLNGLTKEQRAIANKVVASARKYGVPENVALGIAMQESHFDPTAQSNISSAYGIMQITSDTAKQLKINPKNIDENIDGGMRYFKQQLDKYGSVDDALIAYHDGPNSAYFNGGEKSDRAEEHVKRVKSYAGLPATQTDTDSKFNVGIADIEPAAQFDDEATQGGGEARGYEDVAAGAVGAATGYGVGKNRQMSMNEKALNLRAQALAQRQQQTAISEAEKQALANRPPAYGSGTENWKNTEYGEPIARQINQPVSKSQAVTEADAAIARHNKAKQLFPSQVPASPGSQLTIPLTLGGKTTIPTQPPTTAAPAPAAAPRLQDMPAMKTLNAPGRGSTAITTGFGGLAGAQAYDTYRKALEHDWAGAGRSGLATLEALIAAGSRRPIVKALSGVASGATAVGPELMDYFRNSEEVPAKAEGGMIDSLPHYDRGGSVVKKRVQTILSDLADRYPSLIPGMLKKDVKTGKEFVGKALSDEEIALQKARNAAQKEIDKGNYQPFFDVSQRVHVDPANYPMKGATITDALPKQAKTKEKWAQQFDTPEIAARLREAYSKAKDDPLTHNWYAMGQLEQEFIKELGPEMGRKMFRERFAEPMAATTGGADPTANLLSSYYGNFMRQAGTPMGGASHELPHPIGGRYIMGNLDQYNKIINQGAGLTTATPKRFNFASDFMGHQNRPTLDEQMTGIFDPKLAAPPGDSYGVMEAVLNKAAAAEGVSPVNFQEVAWAGQKGTKGKPMIQHVNEAIERTARVTGKTPEEVLRDSIIHARSPLYGGAAVGLGGLGQYEDRR
jgi:hypothetical protein